MPWTSPTQHETAVSAATPTPRRYRCKLDTVRACASETAKLYREARSGLLPVDQAYKLASILQNAGRQIEAASVDDLASRLDQLEGRTAPPAARRVA